MVKDDLKVIIPVFADTLPEGAEEWLKVFLKLFYL